jgi:hypothetical protein
MHDAGDLFERHFMDDTVPQRDVQGEHQFKLRRFDPQLYHDFVDQFLGELCQILGSDHLKERLKEFGHFENGTPLTKSKYLEFLYRKALSVTKQGCLEISFKDSLDVFSFAVNPEDFGTAPFTKVQKQNLLVVYTKLKGFQTFLSNISDPLMSFFALMDVVERSEVKSISNVADSAETPPPEDLGGR